MHTYLWLAVNNHHEWSWGAMHARCISTHFQHEMPLCTINTHFSNELLKKMDLWVSDSVDSRQKIFCSRCPITSFSSNNLRINNLSTYTIEERYRRELQLVMCEDRKLQALQRFPSNRWPVKKSKVSKCLQPLLELSRWTRYVENGILFKSHTILIPRSLKTTWIEFTLDTKGSKSHWKKPQNLYSGQDLPRISKNAWKNVI